MFSASKVIKSLNEASKTHTPCLFALDYEMDRGLFVANPYQQEEIFFRVPNQPSHLPQTLPITQSCTLTAHPETLSDYTQRFEFVMNHLKRGDSFLTNLTIETPISLDSAHDPMLQIALQSHSPYMIYWPDHFVCFSPERFIQIERNHISSHPMKGTINAAIPHAAQLILNDQKETEEHCTIVDFIRSDLSRVATNIQVPRFRYIDKVSTSHGDILQVSSEITGDILGPFKDNLGNLLEKILPAGSISGAPKRATCSVIKEAEQRKRGYYSGIFGLYNGDTLDTGVMIRYIERRNNAYFFSSGGGITINSDCQKEYQEVIQKIYLPK